MFFFFGDYALRLFNGFEFLLRTDLVAGMFSQYVYNKSGSFSVWNTV